MRRLPVWRHDDRRGGDLSSAEGLALDSPNRLEATAPALRLPAYVTRIVPSSAAIGAPTRPATIRPPAPAQVLALPTLPLNSPRTATRGLYRKEYTGVTLRENLGLPVPSRGAWRLPDAAE